MMKPLTNDELSLITPIVIKVMLKTNPDNRMYSTEITYLVNRLLSYKKIDYNLHSSRLRKIVNYLRSTAQLPIHANNKGYFISWEKRYIDEEVSSLESRIESMKLAIKGLKKIRKKSGCNSQKSK